MRATHAIQVACGILTPHVDSMRKLILLLTFLAACDTAVPPSPDAAFTTPMGPPPACVVGWHAEGCCCVLDADAGVDATPTIR